jgi:hypothetical protein
MTAGIRVSLKDTEKTETACSRARLRNAAILLWKSLSLRSAGI